MSLLIFAVAKPITAIVNIGRAIQVGNSGIEGEGVGVGMFGLITVLNAYKKPFSATV